MVFLCGGRDDGAELDGRLYYRVSTAFRLITVGQFVVRGTYELDCVFVGH